MKVHMFVVWVVNHILFNITTTFQNITLMCIEFFVGFSCGMHQVRWVYEWRCKPHLWKCTQAGVYFKHCILIIHIYHTGGLLIINIVVKISIAFKQSDKSIFVMFWHEYKIDYKQIFAGELGKWSFVFGKCTMWW